jgi:hypothetical protein
MWLPVTTAPMSFGLDLSMFFMTVISPQLTLPELPPLPVTALAVFEKAWLYAERTISFWCAALVALPTIPSSLRKISSAAAAGPLAASPSVANAQNCRTIDWEIPVLLQRRFIRYSSQ